jgi:endothelin-converting enzyme/putative endopeptidase
MVSVTSAVRLVPPLPAGIDAASIDPSVSPCDDFFQYACGGWVKANPIPADKSRWTAFDKLAEGNLGFLKTILERDMTSPPPDEPYSKAIGDYYSACMDEDAAEKADAKPLQPELKRIDAVSDVNGFARELGRLHKMGVRAFFEATSDQDLDDTTKVILGIDQDGLGLPDRDYYLKSDAMLTAMRDKYQAHVERVFTLLGEAPAAAKKDAEAVLALEKSLADSQISRVDHRDPKNLHHTTDEGAFVKSVPSFNWDLYFHELGLPTPATVNVAVPSTLAFFDKELAGATKDTWAGSIRPYLRFTLARVYSDQLSKRFVDENFAMNKELSGQSENEPRWKRCARLVDRGLGEALAIPFVKEKLGPEGKDKTETMINEVEASMLADLASLPWMDDATRARAAEKVHKLVNKVGYPAEWRKYDALKIDRKSLVDDRMNAVAFETHRDLAKIGKPLDRAEWHMTPPTVNAYYEPQLNEMVFPAGILQSPFFSLNAPQPVNLGAIGVVMGHELTHGFDDQGRKFDAEGNLKEWWSPQIGSEFDKRASCVVDQFNDYVAVDDLHVNGKLTLGENLADLGGLRLALRSLRTEGNATLEAQRELFMGYSQVWCGATRPERAQVLARVDPHSPSKWRVNGPLSNLPEFATAFQCQAGSPMVRPEEKQCTVW